MEYDHKARPDDNPEPGDRCKDCGEDVTWIGPTQYDWVHVGKMNEGIKWGEDPERDCKELIRLEAWGLYPTGHHKQNCPIHISNEE